MARRPLVAAWVLAACALVVFSLWAWRYTTRWQPDGRLTATVIREGSETPVHTTSTVGFVDPLRLAADAGLDPTAPFIVEWRGLLVAEDAGTHRLRIRADDGVVVWVNDRIVIDEPRNLGQVERMGTMPLGIGLHPFRLRYVQRGGESVLRVSWTRPSLREEYGPLLLTSDTEPPPLMRRISKARGYPLLVAELWSLWLIVGLGFAGCALLERLAGAPLRTAAGRPALTVIGLVLLPLLALTINLGVHPWRGWGPDEIQPVDAIGAVTHAFGGGWFHLYPPLHFYVLAIVNAPFLLLMERGALSSDDAAVLAGMHTVDRSVSLMLAGLTLVTVAILAGRVSTRARLLAPAALAGIPLFAFYARTTNVDMAYTFWVAAAALALQNAWERRTVGNHVVLGALAAAAVAAKDQAYGYLPGAALVLVWAAWRDTAGRPVIARLGGVAGDRRLWAGLVTFAVVYTGLVGLWWNAEGMRAHVDLITGPASVPFRLFEPTPGGAVRLTLTTLTLIGQAVGPLVLATAIVGLGVSVSRARSAALVGLAAMTVGYLVTFVGVVGYVYDRFLVAVLLLVALLAGWGGAWLIGRLARAEVRTAATVVLIGALLVPTLVLTAEQATDTRFEAETWMADHLHDDPLVIGVGTALYLPNLHPFQHRTVPTARVPELLEWDPDVVVLNDDWFVRPGQPAAARVVRDLQAAGFTETYRVERPPAGGPLGRVLVSGLFIDPLFSNLNKVSPPLSVWERAARNDATEQVGRSDTPPPSLGGTIVFQSTRGGRDKLYALDIPTRVVTPLTSGADHRDEDPAVSPDGSHVAFSTTRFEADTYDIAVMPLPSGAVRRVAGHPAYERYPAWMPDSRHLIISSAEQGTDALFRIAVEGGDTERLSRGPDRAFQAAPSPDGASVAYTLGTEDGLCVAILGPDRERPRLISSLPGNAVRPRWSPDGRRLAYTRLSAAGSFIEIRDLASEQTRRLSIEGLAAVADPAWSPDGRWLAVTGSADTEPTADWHLYVIAMEGTATAHALTEGRGQDRAPSWVPR